MDDHGGDAAGNNGGIKEYLEETPAGESKTSGVVMDMRPTPMDTAMMMDSRRFTSCCNRMRIPEQAMVPKRTTSAPPSGRAEAGKTPL